MKIMENKKYYKTRHKYNKNDQEWAIITCDENFFNSQPNYITLRIKY